MTKQTIKDVAINTTVVATVTCLINWGIFVTFKEMVAYAAPREDMARIEQQLVRMEKLITKLCIKQHIPIDED